MMEFLPVRFGKIRFTSLAPYNGTDNKETEGKRLLKEIDNAKLGNWTDGV